MSATDLDLLQDLGGDLLAGELVWRSVELQLINVCNNISLNAAEFRKEKHSQLTGPEPRGSHTFLQCSCAGGGVSSNDVQDAQQL